jgi:hypothetical protein
MSDLLTEAVEARGGLDRWKQFRVLEASLSVGGAIWGFSSNPDCSIGLHLKLTSIRKK